MSLELLKKDFDAQFVASAVYSYDGVGPLVQGVINHHNDVEYFHNKIIKHASAQIRSGGKVQILMANMSSLHSLYPIDLSAVEFKIELNSSYELANDRLSRVIKLLETYPDQNNVLERAIKHPILDKNMQKKGEPHYLDFYMNNLKSKYPLTDKEAVAVTDWAAPVSFSRKHIFNCFKSDAVYQEYLSVRFATAPYDWIDYNCNIGFIKKVIKDVEQIKDIDAKEKIAQRLYNASQKMMLQWRAGGDITNLQTLIDLRSEIKSVLTNFVGRDFQMDIDEEFLEKMNYKKKNRLTKSEIETMFEDFPLKLIDNYKPPKTQNLSKLAKMEKDVLNLRMSYQTVAAKTGKFKI